MAHVVLPATHFGEKDGTYTNRQGRLQRLNAAIIPPEGAMQDSEIFARLLDLSGDHSDAYTSPREIFRSLAQKFDRYRDVDFDSIGDQGVDVEAAAAEHHGG